MNRRMFVKLSGLVAFAGALKVSAVTAGARSGVTAAERVQGVELERVPAGIRVTTREPGTYRISGRVRLDGPLVEIRGITHAQSISRSDADRSLSTFTTFETFDRAGMARTISVRGGQLDTVTVVPTHFG